MNIVCLPAFLPESLYGERFSNSSHRSKTDPDTCLYQKEKGKEARLSYPGHYVIDFLSKVILAAEAAEKERPVKAEAGFG